MLKKLFFIASLLIILFNSSCKKSFLNVSDKASIARQDYVVDLKTTKEFLNGVYLYLSKNFYVGLHQIYPELIADNMKPITTYFNLLTPQYNWDMHTPISNMNELWLYGYQVARSCSFVLEKAEAYKNQSPEMAKDLLGQAYAIRALVHLEMVQAFAQPYNFSSNGGHLGIPYAKTYDLTQPLTRLTVAQVYQELLGDLNKALELLPTTPVNVAASKAKYVMNPNAVRAMLARVFLYMEDFAKAKMMAVGIVNDVPLLSGSNYPAKLFTPSETEALFQLVPSYPDGITGTFATTYQGALLYNGEITQFMATADIAEILTKDPNDKRKAWISSGGYGQDTIIKYPRGIISAIKPASASYYQTIFRSSEMCLIAAESFAHLVVEDSARYYLDAIRLRANPTLSQSTVSGAALLDSICLERRKELAFEGHRMYDLLRWKKGVTRTDVANNAPKVLTYPNNRSIAPIPENDVQLLGIPQNPGY